MTRTIAAVLGLCLVACAKTAVDAECRAACARADECGFLPSALGGFKTPRQNCEERCSLSDKDEMGVRYSVTKCFEAKRDVPLPALGDWCEARSRCEFARACLSDRLTDRNALGRATLRVQLRVPVGADAGVDTTTETGPSDAEACGAGGSDRGSGDHEVTGGCAPAAIADAGTWYRDTRLRDAEALDAAAGDAGARDLAACGARVCRQESFDFCKDRDIQTIRIHVHRGTVRLDSRELACDEAVAAPIEFRNLPPGRVTVQVELWFEASRDDDASEPRQPSGPLCSTPGTFERVLLRASCVANATIALGCDESCERQCERNDCSDGRDNDGNGESDCMDPGCECASAAQTACVADDADGGGESACVAGRSPEASSGSGPAGSGPVGPNR